MSQKAYDVIKKGIEKEQLAARYRAHLIAVAELEARMELVRQELQIRSLDLSRLEREIRSFESGYTDYDLQSEASIGNGQQSSFPAFLLGRFPLLTKAVNWPEGEDQMSSEVKVAQLLTRVRQLEKKLRQPLS